MSQPALRLFVALALPEEVRVELVRWRAPVLAGTPGLRPVGEEGLHVTLCFLGMVGADAVPAILDASLELSGLPEARLTVGKPLWLAPRRPHVLTVSLLDAGDRLAAAQGRLSQALAAAGVYEPEARPFLPHVTVARVRRGARVRARELDGPAPVEFAGRSVVLFRSVPGGGGARYEPLGAVELAPG